jgi:hypothetical protein
MVMLDGKCVVAQYGQWDGYPTGQGMIVLTFLRDKMNRELFEKQCRASVFSSGERWDEIEEFCKTEDRFLEMYPQVSRDTAAEVLEFIQNHPESLVVELVDNSEFAGESLSCEWAYVIDLDKNTLEVFVGYNKKKLPKKARFFSLGSKVSNGTTYYPVKLKVAFDLNDLPSDEEFIKKAGGK